MTVETLKIYEIDRHLVWTGRWDEVTETQGAPAGWTFAPEPPETAPGERLRWDGAWSVVTVDQVAATLASAKRDALGQIADQRWRATETFTYDGVVAPADSALGAVVGFVVGAQIAPPTGPVTWKLAQGEFRAWSLEQVIDYGIAIRAHIQACFDAEAALTANIQAADSVQDIANIVVAASAAWPT